jgi:hypothetical protein
LRARGRPCGAPVLVEVAGTRGENATAAGRTTLPGKSTGRPRSANACAAPWSGVTTRGVHHRLAEVLEPFGGIPVTGDAGQDPDARAAMLGQAEAVITSRSGLGTPRWRSASAWRGRRSPRPRKNPQSDIYRARSGPRRCTSWLAEGGFRRGSARRRPSSVHCGIMLSSAPAAMRSWAAAPRSRLIESALAGAGQDARHLGQQIRPVARYLAELGRRRGDFGLGWLTPAGMPLGCAVQAGNEQTVRGGSGAITGHQAIIEHESDKGKLARLVFRPPASRKDRRWRPSRQRRRTVRRH